MSHRDWAPIIATLISGEALDYDQSYWLMDQVMSGELGEARLASFLTAMAIKGATVEEIHGLADGMQDHAASVDLPSRALDIVGTGGDGYKTVNISTMSAIVAASMGIPLVKHGNRASTSKSGSADVIEALGVNLDVEPADLRRIFDQVGIAFLFANKMHPSMRFAAPVRRALGFPTAFNVLGPLTNPAKVQACAIGAAKEENARLMAGVYASRGLSALVLRGATTGLDELTTADSNQIWIVSGGQVSEVAFDARESLGMASSSTWVRASWPGRAWTTRCLRIRSRRACATRSGGLKRPWPTAQERAWSNAGRRPPTADMRRAQARKRSYGWAVA